MATRAMEKSRDAAHSVSRWSIVVGEGVEATIN